MGSTCGDWHVRWDIGRLFRFVGSSTRVCWLSMGSTERHFQSRLMLRAQTKDKSVRRLFAVSVIWFVAGCSSASDGNLNADCFSDGMH